MVEALQNVAAMFLIMMASYVLMKKEPFPVEVVNNLVFHFFLPVTTFYSIARLQTLPAGELLLVTASGFVALCATYLFAILIARLCGLGDRFRKTFLWGPPTAITSSWGFPSATHFWANGGRFRPCSSPSAGTSSSTGWGSTS